MVVTEPVFTVCGTPTYVAPEILAETGYGVGVDVWAMGVILFVLLSGFPPFRSPDRNQEELFRLIQKGEVHFLSPYWDNVSEGAKALVRALLEVNPNRRLTARQTLQQDWLQHAAAQQDHEGAAKATHTTADRQRLNRQLEINKRDSHKPEMLAEKFHAAQIHENILNNNYEPDINAHDRNQEIEEIQNMMSNQQYSSHAEDIQNTTDQHVPEKPAQQEDSKQEYTAE